MCLLSFVFRSAIGHRPCEAATQLSKRNRVVFLVVLAISRAVCGSLGGKRVALFFVVVDPFFLSFLLIALANNKKTRL